MFITPIGVNPEQIEYRLEGGHGCSSDHRLSYHVDGGERPLTWIGGGLGEVDITAGARFGEADVARARALMNGQDPRSGEQLVARKVAVFDDSKLPLSGLVDTITAHARTHGVPVEELFAGNARATAAWGRAARAVQVRGDAALLRADEAGALAQAAGVTPEQVWGSEEFSTAVANLTETVTDPNDPSGASQVVVPRRRVVGNSGYDATFTLPKSLSLLLAFTDEDTAAALEDRYLARVGDTFDWLEAETSYGMRGKHGGGKTARTVLTSGFLGWAMVHRSARPVGPAPVGDPHWHVHISVANMARGLDDGQWGTVAAGGRDLMRHAPAADHVLKALLRRDLSTQFGVAFTRNTRNGNWEVAAIPDEVLRDFSKRGRSIEAMLTDLGFDTATASRRAQALAEADTRQRKSHTTTAPDATLRQYWADEARALGHDPHTLAAAAVGGLDWRQKVPPSPQRAAEAIAATVLDPQTGVTANRRRFTRAEAIAAVADALPHGAADLAEIAVITDLVLASQGVVALDDQPTRGRDSRSQLGRDHMSNAQRYTTADILDVEAEILVRASAAAAGQAPTDIAVTAEAADLARQVAETAQGYPLSPEQAAALVHLVTSDKGIDAVLGVAGSGKTTLMRAVRTAYEAAGYRVVGAATAAVAAQNLASESGIEARTVAQWLHATDRDPIALQDVDVMVLDEANLTDDRDRARLWAAAAAAGAKIIEVGDPKQLRGVGCGSLFARVHDTVAGPELVDNRRQRSADERATIAAWRDGRFHHALAQWAGRGQLVATDTADQAVTAMVAEWLRQRDGAPDPHTQMQGLVMLAATNEAVDRLNEAVQAVRGATGELGAEASYRTSTGSLLLAEGDHVLIRINDRAQRLHHGPDVLNGYRGVIDTIHPDRSVTVTWTQPDPDGQTHRSATLDPAFIAKGGMSLGYAMTGHKAEGLTVAATWQRSDGDTHHGSVLVHAAGLDAAGLHVATTRHRDHVILFAGRDQVEDLNAVAHPPASNAERIQRVRDALADRATATHISPNDQPVHDDLNQTPTPRRRPDPATPPQDHAPHL